jgi:hypothetical protein
MLTEIDRALQSLTALKNLVQAKKSMSNFREIRAAVSEVDEKLTTAYIVAWKSQEKQTALIQYISELEKENAELKNWNREAERYQLDQIVTGAFAYSLKPGRENGEPAHYLCTNCFGKREKSILQVNAPGTKAHALNCPRCGTKIPIAQQQTPFSATRR